MHCHQMNQMPLLCRISSSWWWWFQIMSCMLTQKYWGLKNHNAFLPHNAQNCWNMWYLAGTQSIICLNTQVQVHLIFFWNTWICHFCNAHLHSNAAGTWFLCHGLLQLLEGYLASQGPGWCFRCHDFFSLLGSATIVFSSMAGSQKEAGRNTSSGRSPKWSTNPFSWKHMESGSGGMWKNNKKYTKN